MQFQVPQNIDLEDKIIGPLTLKQFIILLVGGMFDYMWYTFFDTGLFIILALPTTLFTLALVFARVQEEPFPKFLANLALFTIKPKILIWGKGPRVKIIETKKAKKKEKFVAPKASSESEIQRLSQIIDTQGWSGSAAKAGSKPEIPATPALSPIPKAKTKPKSFIEKVTQKTRAREAPAARVQPVQPKISQPQPIKTPVVQRPPVVPKSAQPVIRSADIKQIAQEERTSQAKIKKAAAEIAQKLKNTPPNQIKPKEPFWKKIINKLIANQETPESRRQRMAAQVSSPEDIEEELGLNKRIKSHAAVKPKLNLGPASKNVPEDPFEKVEP